ncbi:MAG: hypothetical protein AB7D07_10210 [Desulfovibrionaceae bacterium]
MSPPPAGVDLRAIADKAKYVGSAEHKDTPSFAGHPRPRADASICDRKFVPMQDYLTEQLPACIRRGIVGAPWEGEFPRYVWGQIEGRMFEARLVNKSNGLYEGYPLEEDERPEGVTEFDG